MGKKRHENEALRETDGWARTRSGLGDRSEISSFRFDYSGVKGSNLPCHRSRKKSRVAVLVK